MDNIGDFSACQSADDPDFKKPNWRSIENGIRGNALGTAISGLLGGPIQSTATTNIGIAGASGITSRVVAYLAGTMLMVAAFFPGLTGLLSLIPTPVLGAISLYSGCYIMAGGFSALSDTLPEQEENAFQVCRMILNHMFEDVRFRTVKGTLVIDLNADL